MTSPMKRILPILLLLLSSCLQEESQSTTQRHEPASGQEARGLSPDSRIAFTSLRENGDQVVFTVKPDGTERQEISPGWGRNVSFGSWADAGSGLYVLSELQGKTNGYLIRIPSLQKEAITAVEGDMSEFTVTPDGKFLYYADYVKKCLVEQPVGRGDAPKVVVAEYSESPRCSLDGELVSFTKREPGDSHSRDVWVYSRANHATYPVAIGKGFDGMVSWLPSHKLLVVSDEDGKHQIYVHSLPGPARRRIATGMHPLASPNGRYVAFLSQGALHIVDIDSGAIACTWSSKGTGWSLHFSPDQLAWGPDNRELAFIVSDWTKEDEERALHSTGNQIGRDDHDYAIMKIGLGTGKMTLLHRSGKRPIFNLGWSPN